MQIQRSTIDPILRQFFDHELAGKAGLSRSRIEVVERRLRECLEAEAERILVTGDLEILAAERQFMQDGAVARTMHAEDLVFILSLFVCDPWLPDDPVQRATQLRLAEYLTGHLLVARFVDREQVVCPPIDIRVVIDTEKVLRRSRAAVHKRTPQ